MANGLVSIQWVFLKYSTDQIIFTYMLSGNWPTIWMLWLGWSMEVHSTVLCYILLGLSDAH